VPTGWAEFLERFKQQVDSGQADPHALWSEFLQRSQTSPRAQALDVFASIVQKTPVEERVSVAFMVAALLDPLEWPPEWEQHRSELLDALGALDSAIAPGKPDSLATLLALGPDDMGYWGGVLMFLIALQLLSTPCRRDQLPTVARLCWTGLFGVLKAYQVALARAGESARSGPILEARMRFDAAFDRYAQAARALNAAVGEVLFQRLDERLEVPEI
jgi:hypothetical protein